MADLDLSTLSVEELRKLQAKAQSEIVARERKPGRSRILEDWHEALSVVLGKFEGIRLPPYPVWQAQQPAKNARPHLESAEQVVLWLYRSTPMRLDLMTGREFVTHMLTIYVRDVIGVPITVGGCVLKSGQRAGGLGAQLSRVPPGRPTPPGSQALAAGCCARGVRVSFGSYEQEAILAIMALGKDGAPNVARELVVPDCFDPHYRVIFDRVSNFLDRHKEAPGLVHFEDLIRSIAATEPDDAEVYLDLHTSIVTLIDRGLNYEYVFSRTEQYMRHKRLRIGCGLALQELEVFDPERTDAAEKHLLDAMQANVSVMDMGINTHDVDSMLRFMDETRTERFSTGIPELDRFSMNPARKELLLILGAYGTGKSFGMNEFALAGLHINRVNTLIVPCEMSEDEWAERVVQSETGMGRRAQVVQIPKIHQDSGGLFVDLEHQDIKIESLYAEHNYVAVHKAMSRLRKKPGSTSNRSHLGKRRCLRSKLSRMLFSLEMG